MLRAMRILSAMALLALVVTGCSSDTNPVSPTLTSSGPLAQAAHAIPADATIDSARVMLFATTSDAQTVTFHRVTAAWDEASLTFNALGGNFDPTPFTSLALADSGWYSVDVTSEVNGWFDSTVTNNGFLIAPQADTTLSSLFASKERSSNAPYLIVCYTTFEGPACDTLEVIDDATVYTAQPDQNASTDTTLLVEREPGADSVYYAAIQFDFPVAIRYASLGDRVWLDDNKDGLQDSSEAGLSGVMVELYSCADSSMVGMTTTDGSGMYLFDSLEAGDYYIQVLPPADHGFSPIDQGSDDALDSDVAMNGMSACVTLMPGETYTDLDAGLVLFDGCTRGKGYWKNRTGFGPQGDEVTPLLPIWLGTDGGDNSLAVTDAQIAYDVLQQHTYGHPKNGITKLYAHLLTAKLNIASYANPADIADAIDEADAFLADYSWEDWDMLSKEQQKWVHQWKGMSEDYNEGEIGPGSCDDDDHDDGDDDDEDDDDDDDDMDDDEGDDDDDDDDDDSGDDK